VLAPPLHTACRRLLPEAKGFVVDPADAQVNRRRHGGTSQRLTSANRNVLLADIARVARMDSMQVSSVITKVCNFSLPARCAPD
jgi:hypothetical protein